VIVIFQKSRRAHSNERGIGARTVGRARADD